MIPKSLKWLNAAIVCLGATAICFTMSVKEEIKERKSDDAWLKATLSGPKGSSSSQSSQRPPQSHSTESDS